MPIEIAAHAIWAVVLPGNLRSAAQPYMCSEFSATPEERARNRVLVFGDRYTSWAGFINFWVLAGNVLGFVYLFYV